MIDTTTLVWPEHKPVAGPLPHYGRCADCVQEIRIRRDGRLYGHGCLGDGTLPLVVLEPTFCRWLYSQSKRRDGWTNPITRLADHLFNGCTRSPKRAPADMAWTTAAELHEHRHRTAVERHGTAMACDWSCADIAEAAALYEALTAANCRNGET